MKLCHCGWRNKRLVVGSWTVDWFHVEPETHWSLIMMNVKNVKRSDEHISLTKVSSIQLKVKLVSKESPLPHFFQDKWHLIRKVYYDMRFGTKCVISVFLIWKIQAPDPFSIALNANCLDPTQFWKWPERYHYKQLTNLCLIHRLTLQQAKLCWRLS